MNPWREVGAGVYVRRYRFLDQSIGAIVGDERVLIVDTRSTLTQGQELLADLRELTALPWVVVNTHAHFDHVLGNAAFRPCEAWGHLRCAENMRSSGPALRERALAWSPESLDDLTATPIDPPERTFAAAADLDLGGRIVQLRHLGRGHTDHDVIVRDAASGVLFAGDLLEQGSPPWFDDAFPLDWPDTLGVMLDLVGEIVVPGHGEPVAREFVEGQLAEIAYLAETARRSWSELQAAGHDPAAPAPAALVADAARHLGWPDRPVRDALGRGLAQAAGVL